LHLLEIMNAEIHNYCIIQSVVDSASVTELAELNIESLKEGKLHNKLLHTTSSSGNIHSSAGLRVCGKPANSLPGLPALQEMTERFQPSFRQNKRY